MESSIFVKICYVLKGWCEKLGFESGKGFDFLNSEMP
jgi:hypothetical protein